MKNMMLFVAALLMALSVAPSVHAKDKFLKSKGQQINYREANMYASQAEKRDIIVGAEFLSKDQQKRLLGNKIDKFAVVETAITNNSRFRLYVNSLQFMGAGGGAALSMVGLDEVAKVNGPSGSGNKNAMQLSILRNNLIDKSLQAIVILPGETVQGLVFLREKERGASLELKVDMQNLKRLVYLDIAVPLSQ